jgi:ribosomal protein S27AE/Zn finger protein HypA/HybF involved in hydrogenase expression
LSSPSLTAEELGLLNTIKNAAGEDGLAKVFDVNDAGVVVPVIPVGEEVSAEGLMERLEGLVEKGMLRKEFESKILKCARCGGRKLMPKTACPSCGSENISKSPVYLHGCGALIPDVAVGKLTSCPKCGEGLGALNVMDYRFICGNCGAVFEEPRSNVRCVSCGWQGHVKNAGQIVLMKYGLTEEGLSVLLSTDPLKMLVRKLVLNGYVVRLGVKVRGISGAEYVLDLVAVKGDRSETRIYMVFYRVSPSELLNSALKRLDIEKTSVEGVVGSVRWVAAGLEVDEKAEQVAKTFGVDLELIS